MKATRRRKSDYEASRDYLRSLPHTATYPAMGFAMGLCTPLGAFVMRYLLAGPLLTTQ